MGFQIGGAILDFVVLSILQHNDTYGYEITRQVRRILDVSETALYPALRRLEKPKFYWRNLPHYVWVEGSLIVGLFRYAVYRVQRALKIT